MSRQGQASSGLARPATEPSANQPAAHARRPQVEPVVVDMHDKSTAGSQQAKDVLDDLPSRLSTAHHAQGAEQACGRAKGTIIETGEIGNVGLEAVDRN